MMESICGHMDGCVYECMCVCSNACVHVMHMTLCVCVCVCVGGGCLNACVHVKYVMWSCMCFLCTHNKMCVLECMCARDVRDIVLRVCDVHAKKYVCSNACVHVMYVI